MTDIVERLRRESNASYPHCSAEVMSDAADEIERLRNNEAATLKTIETIQIIRQAGEAENEKLRAVVEAAKNLLAKYPPRGTPAYEHLEQALAALDSEE